MTIQIELTKEQQEIANEIYDWFKFHPESQEYQTICGYAGTGKTVLISALAKKLRYKEKLTFAFCSYTGKSASVLRKKLNDHNSFGCDDFCGTIHQLIYKPKTLTDPVTKLTKIIGWEKRWTSTYDLIIIDEASMINESIWEDLKQLKIPIIIVGDHGQLPCIGKGVNLLDSNINSNIYTLKKIHRQAKNNPIIQMSIDVRNKGRINPGIYSPNVFKLDWNEPKTKILFNKIELDQETIILCGFNSTRVELNNIIRKKKNFNKSYPYIGEKIICLKNNRISNIMNGQLGILKWMAPKGADLYEITVDMDGTDELYYGLAHKFCFGKTNYEGAYELTLSNNIKKYNTIFKKCNVSSIDLFDYGYALSVHKSQGSEWNRVVLFEQKSNYWDDDFYSKWLYTAITRAKDKLCIIYNYE